MQQKCGKSSAKIDEIFSSSLCLFLAPLFSRESEKKLLSGVFLDVILAHFAANLRAQKRKKKKDGRKEKFAYWRVQLGEFVCNTRALLGAQSCLLGRAHQTAAGKWPALRARVAGAVVQSAVFGCIQLHLAASSCIWACICSERKGKGSARDWGRQGGESVPGELASCREFELSLGPVVLRASCGLGLGRMWWPV